MPHIYEPDGAAIYRASFATIRAEADLARFTPEEEVVAVRMIHASGMVELAPHVRFAPGFAIAARAALEAGAPILCDARMVSEGITRARLPAGNEVICTLQDPDVPALAARLGTTRSAAALELWRPHLAGAVVAIGNAPTALFHLLNLLQDPAFPRPAAIIGCPVGFIGAAESKAALATDDPRAVVRGRRQARRSAITVAAVNALASRKGMTMQGKVICIGLGPGDPELMSVRPTGCWPGRRWWLFPQGGRPGRQDGWPRADPAGARGMADGISGDDRDPSMIPLTTAHWRRSTTDGPRGWPMARPLATWWCCARATRSSTAVSVTCIPACPRIWSRWIRVSGHGGLLDGDGMPITWGDDVLTVLPATLPQAEWPAAPPIPMRWW